MSSYPQASIKIEEEVTVAMASIQMHPRSQSGSTAPAENNALTLRKRTTAPETLISDEMGYEVVTLRVGEQATVFNVHKNLITATSATLSDLFETALPPGQYHMLKDVDPAAFKLFMEFLYTRRVPAVTATMNESAKAARTKQLYQFYAFCDKYYLKFEIRNKVMDRIQDAFLLMDKFPEPILVHGIYENTLHDSLLRSFALVGAYYGFRTGQHVKGEDFKKLLKSNDVVLDDFLELVASNPAEGDPRIRQCHGWEGCVECADHAEGHARIDGPGGVFPCKFHVHRGTLSRAKEGSSGPPGTNIEYVEVADIDGCYLWNTFPDLEWMEKHMSKLS